MTPSPQSGGTSFRGDVLAPTASSLRMRATNGAASATTAAPSEPDPAHAVAHESGVGFTEPDRPYDHVMPRAVVRHEGIQSYVSCPCGFTTGYTESDAQAARIAYDHTLSHDPDAYSR